MDLLKSIQSFGTQLSNWLSEDNQSEESVGLRKIIADSCYYNHWFVEDEIYRRLRTITTFIGSGAFEKEFSNIKKTKECKKIALVSEERIPAEEFSTILSILLSGNNIIYRINEKQDKIIQYIFQILFVNFADSNTAISFIDGQIRDFNKLITISRDSWTESKRKIISKHNSLEIARHQSVALIEESTSSEEIKNLATDVFSYFGMGCGNVKKIYLPEVYQINKIIELFEDWQDIINHNPYANHYQYHQSIFLMNSIKHLDNGFLLFQENKAICAPTGVLYFEYYQNKNQLLNILNNTVNINSIYISKPQHNKEKSFGSSLNQLLLPSQQIIDFLI